MKDLILVSLFCELNKNSIATKDPAIKKNKKLFDDISKDIKNIVDIVVEKKTSGNSRKYLASSNAKNIKTSKKKRKNEQTCLADFNRFELVGSLLHSQEYLLFSDKKYLKATSKAKCPFCLEEVDNLENHLKEELEIAENKTRVAIDPAFGVDTGEIVVACINVKNLKEIIFDKLGISVSKQEIIFENKLLSNNTAIKNISVLCRLKARR